jgi:hypothetical protein
MCDDIISSSSTTSMECSHLLAALLAHPVICHDQQLVLRLAQTSKHLRTAVEEVCSGRMPVMLSVQGPQGPSKAQCFAQHWLPKHAKLLDHLEVDLDGQADDSRGAKQAWAAAVEAVVTAVQQHGQHCRLRSFAYETADISTLPAALLQQLPARSLTSLTCAADFSPASAKALSHLTCLRALNLANSTPAYAEDEAAEAAAADGAAAVAAVVDVHAMLAAIAGLRKLEQLRIGTVTVTQLQQLPAQQLRRLHLEVDVQWQPSSVRQLASWLQQYGSILCSLTVTGADRCNDQPELAEEAQAVATALAAAAIAEGEQEAMPAHDATAAGTEGAGEGAAAAAVAAAPAPAAVCSSNSRLQLQWLDLGEDLAVEPVLPYLPVGSLQTLQCALAVGQQQHVRSLAGLRALQQLLLQIPLDADEQWYAHLQPETVLAPLSSLHQVSTVPRMHHVGCLG